MFELDIVMNHTSHASAQMFADRLTKIPEIQRVDATVNRETKSWHVDWYELTITIRPYAGFVAGYVAKKLLDQLIVDVKEYFRRDTTPSERRRATIIYGPDGKVLSVVEIEEGNITVRE
jgi:hypothetical protein